jgi:PAS domain S-box-containing protein
MSRLATLTEDGGTPRGAESSPPATPTRRLTALIGVVGVLLAAGLLIPPDGLSNPAWHLTIEVGSVVLAAVLGALALARFYARRQRIFVFIGTGFLATGVLDAVHAFVSSDLLGGSGLAVSADVAAWTWLQARVFLSLFLSLSAFGALDDDGREIHERRVYTVALVLTAAVLLVFGLAPTPRAVHPGWLLPRPGELLPALLFGAASVGYLRRGRWRTDAFEYWLVLGLAIAAVGHLAFMSRSVALYDPFFDAGHLLKLISYLAVGGGLLVSMHDTFRREEEALRVGAVANEALAHEVEVRREAEAVLQRSEERLQGFLDSAHDLIQSTSPDGRIVYVNRAWERALGYDRSEMHDMELASLLHPRCRRRVLKQFRKTLEGDTAEEIVAEFITKDGAVVVCAGRATRHMVDGTPVATQAIFRDVTAQRAAERDLAASRANVQALVENTGDMIWSIDTRRHLVTFNSAFSLATEARWGREPRVGDDPVEVFGPDDADWYTEIYARALRGQRFSVLHEDSLEGQTRAFEIFCNPVNEGSGTTGAVMFGRDVTRRIEAEEAIRLAKEEAEAANQAKSQFLANMSHELRTPLNSVIGFANILLKNKQNHLDEKELGYLGRVQANGRHLLALINEVLDLAKIEAGRMDLLIEEVDLGEFIAETVGQLEGQAREREVLLEASFPSEAARTIRTDPAKLKQVLINLVGNALKFSEGGSVTVQLEVDLKGIPTSLAVRDSGIGIQPDRLEAIFHAFSQADQSTSRRFGGTGLGLAISRSMCHLLGYELEVESTVGKGSTFTIRLDHTPRAEAPSGGGAGVTPPRAEPGESPRTSDPTTAAQPRREDPTPVRRVLVVEDHEEDRIALARKLAELGLEVLMGSSGKEGLDLAHEARPDLITMAALLPDLTSGSVLRQLKSHPVTAAIPVILMVEPSMDPVGFGGQAGVIVKPVEHEDLRRALAGLEGATSPRPMD